MKGTKDSPDQYGIFWTFKYDNNTLNHYYWNNKDKIEISEWVYLCYTML